MVSAISRCPKWDGRERSRAQMVSAISIPTAFDAPPACRGGCKRCCGRCPSSS